MLAAVRAPRGWLAIMAIAFGVLASGCSSPAPAAGGSHSAAGTTLQVRPLGVLEGGLEACTGIYFQQALPFAAGTVVVLRGVVTSAGGLPKTIVATQTVGPGKLFRFSLQPGAYVLVGHYMTPASIAPWVAAYVPPAVTTTANIPNRCA